MQINIDPDKQEIPQKSQLEKKQFECNVIVKPEYVSLYRTRNSHYIQTHRKNNIKQKTNNKNHVLIVAVLTSFKVKQTLIIV